MDVTRKSMASPDWLKLVWSLAPWITICRLARIWRRGRMRSLLDTRVLDRVPMKRMK
jgi:hypothetical protein